MRLRKKAIKISQHSFCLKSTDFEGRATSPGALIAGEVARPEICTRFLGIKPVSIKGRKGNRFIRLVLRKLDFLLFPTGVAGKVNQGRDRHPFTAKKMPLVTGNDEGAGSW